MKKTLISVLCALYMSFMISPSIAYADWTCGTAKFKGSWSRNSISHGSVIFYYTGILRQTAIP